MIPTIQQANSIYTEDEAIPFRWTIERGNPAPQLQEGVTDTVRLEWDFAGGTTDPGKFFFDYLTTYNATENVTTPPFGTGSDLNGSGSNPDFVTGNLSTVAIPVDPGVLFQTPGVFTLFNIAAGSVQFVSVDGTPEGATDPYVEVLANANQTRKYIDIQFTPNDGDGNAGENTIRT